MYPRADRPVRPREQAGFTLLEMVVGLTLFAVVG